MRHVLTGAGSGIGLALAHRLADRGDDLVLVVRSTARSDELGRTFPRAQLLVADLADPGTLNGLGRQVDGEVDTVLHVAGVVDLGRVDLGALDRVLDRMTQDRHVRGVVETAPAGLGQPGACIGNDDRLPHGVFLQFLFE